jgi:hypothetical protein
VAEEAIEVSYQLEREMHDRVSRYHREAEVHRALPHRSLRAGFAHALHRFADRLEPRHAVPLPGERQIAFPGRND